MISVIPKKFTAGSSIVIKYLWLDIGSWYTEPVSVIFR